MSQQQTATTTNGEEENTATTTQPRGASSKPVLVSVNCNDNLFEISKKYQITGVIGQGAYGIVVAAIDTEKQEKVAIKKIFNVFEQDREYQKRIFREVKILRHLRDHENIVSLKDLVPPRSFEEFKDVYIVTDLMDSDMRAIVKSTQELSDQNIQYFLYQMLKGLKYVHSANVLHRDLKPSNILLNSEMDVKICDFGLSRGVDFEKDPTMSTPYVATRWYRAPELLLMWEKASKALDIWSLGCMFAELLDKPPKRKVLFPGKNYLNQLDLILDFCGSPAESDIKACAKAKKYLRQQPYRPKKDIAKMFPHANPLAIDLLNKMLCFDPEKRITVEEALAHPYLASMHDPQDEPVCERVFDFNMDSIETKDIKKLLYDEIMGWNESENNVAGDAIVDGTTQTLQFDVKN